MRDGRMAVADMRLLQQAAALYGRGDLARAESACRQLLQSNPDQPDAVHILGLIAWQRGERAQAVDDIKGAIARHPNKPTLRNSLGVMLKDLGDPAGAEAEFRAAVALQPQYVEALPNLGNILCDAGRLERTHSPWCPSLRLFRQSRMGDWQPVLAAVARELAVFRPREV